MNLRQLVQVGGDGVQDAVGEGLQVGDGDIQTLLHLGVAQSLLSTHLIGQRTDAEETHNHIIRLALTACCLKEYSQKKGHLLISVEHR